MKQSMLGRFSINITVMHSSNQIVPVSSNAFESQIKPVVGTFLCKFCNKFFFTASEMLEHEKFHVVNKKLTCPVCEMGFARRSYLAEHMCIHNGQQPHSCYYCNKQFSLRCNLVRHVRIHTGEKPFECTICKQTFTLKKNMIEHVRIHTGERPFKCPRCEYSFSRRSSLVRHARIHTGQKSYHCHDCGKTFSWKYYLRRHVSTHLKKRVKSTRKRRTKKQIAFDAAVAANSSNGKTLSVSISKSDIHSDLVEKQNTVNSVYGDTVNLLVDIKNIKIEESGDQPVAVFLPVEESYEENIVKIEPSEEIDHPAYFGKKPEVQNYSEENFCPYVPALTTKPNEKNISPKTPKVIGPTVHNEQFKDNQVLTFSMTQEEFTNYRKKKLLVDIPALMPNVSSLNNN